MPAKVCAIVGAAEAGHAALGCEHICQRIGGSRSTERSPRARQQHRTCAAVQEQDVARWDRNALAAAERLLREASAAGPSGRYQIEAASLVCFQRHSRNDSRGVNVVPSIPEW